MACSMEVETSLASSSRLMSEIAMDKDGKLSLPWALTFCQPIVPVAGVLDGAEQAVLEQSAELLLP
jgi:hypothetical protein